MKKCAPHFCAILAVLAVATSIFLASSPAFALQTPATTYQPKFHGDPARSDSEAAALAYMRVVIRAQRQFNKQYNHFATSLADLVHSGSFTIKRALQRVGSGALRPSSGRQAPQRDRTAS